jgi:putative transposase
VLGQPRGTQRYQSRRPEDEQQLLRNMRRLARQRPRFGADRIHKSLVKDDWLINHKRVHRLWKQENM